MTIKKILLSIAILWLGVASWNSSWFKRAFFPDEYWSNQVAMLEESVELDQASIRDAVMELQKFQLTKHLRLAQVTNFANVDGLSTEAALKEAFETIVSEDQDLRDDIAFSKEMLKEDRAELEKARIQLSRVRSPH
jgi:hypothetical protein